MSSSQTTPIDPRQPVIVGAHELAVRTGDAEPIAMMVAASEGALEGLERLRAHVRDVRVVKGIWPYKDPGRLVSQHLGLAERTSTALTGIGGNATYELVGHTAQQIADGEVDAVLICGAESMRSRRKDRREGRRSTYLNELDGARPDLVVAGDVDMVDELDTAAKVDHPVNFYAMADSVIRHRRAETPPAHLKRISSLWAEGSAIASTNPHAWIQEPASPTKIATTTPTNRMIAAPYTKLLTSNINVDQGAALVMCAYDTAIECGLDTADMVFVISSANAADHLPVRARQDLDRSPAFRLSASRALERAHRSVDDIDHLDLYSCFPASVQLARTELGLGEDRPFTMTGGLTFAGGPFNGYCTQAIAHAFGRLRGTPETALLYGNGGYFSKHSVLVVSGEPPSTRFRHDHVQDRVNALPPRHIVTTDTAGTLEGYTVTYDRQGSPDLAILSVISSPGDVRVWATTGDRSMIDDLLEHDQVGRAVQLHTSTAEPVPAATFT